jgi:Fe-S-cluster containining protein
MLRLVYSDIEGEKGIILESINSSATVADLFAPLQKAADDILIAKREHPKRFAACAACHNNCCRRFRIMPDLLTVKNLLVFLGMDFDCFITQYLDISEDQLFAEFRGRVCPFLKDNLCTIYEIRPAFCRFYLCVPQCERLEKLKAQVLLLGESALRQTLLQRGRVPQAWQNHDFSWSEKPKSNPFFQAVSYDQVTLHSCCSETLWQWMLLPPSAVAHQSYASWRAEFDK